MSYSGTSGQTVINVQTLIDHGARRCGKLAEELTSEQLLSARESLFFLLANLGNIGINYWAINKTVIGLNAEQYIYTLPDGSIDVLNALYRTMTRPTGTYASSAGGTAANAFDNDISTFCQQTSANGNISADFGTSNPQYVGSIGVMPYISGGALGGGAARRTEAAALLIKTGVPYTGDPRTGVVLGGGFLIGALGIFNPLPSWAIPSLHGSPRATSLFAFLSHSSHPSAKRISSWTAFRLWSF